MHKKISQKNIKLKIFLLNLLIDYLIKTENMDKLKNLKTNRHFETK